ncbi:putative peroxidase [[Candida] railenensis]|uniref:Peroxidase n=1 Tax=[Candida] railenensis TaxID=45579 RepID=A0A9P0QLL0_9ASCO|nr:putative peroxidase [[Candida] railenensis]
MPPNYEMSLNPSKANRRSPRRSWSSVVRLVLLPVKYLCVIPVLTGNFWYNSSLEVVQFVIFKVIKLPRKLVEVASFVFFNLNLKELGGILPTSDKDVERAIVADGNDGSTFLQRLRVVFSSISYVRIRLVKYICEKEHDLLRVPLYSDYVIDRYFIHSPFCVLKRVGNERSSYSFKGICLKKNQGFKFYVAKAAANEVQRMASGPINDQVSIENSFHAFENTPAPDLKPESCPYIALVLNETISPKKNEILPIESEDIKCFSISPKELNENSAYNTTPKVEEFSEVVASSFSSFSKQASNKFDEATVGSTPQRKSSKVLKLNINGKELNLKISSKPKLQSSFSKYISSISNNEVQYINEVRSAIRSIIPLVGYDDGSLAPIILRLAWHCCATFDKDSRTGGSNGGTMRFVPEITDEGNTGLDIARSALEPVKQRFPKITYSDLWTLAGCVAIEEMNGPHIQWKSGRYDCTDNKYVPPNGRLPFAYKTSTHIRETFTRMGFNDQETVALLGAHGLGRCHKKFSGWEGKWTSDPINFDNEFYKVLLQDTWEVETVPETGREQYANSDKSLMMLNTDLELVRDKDYFSWVKTYANDSQRFFDDFAQSFGKLLELGIERDLEGNVLLK